MGYRSLTCIFSKLLSCHIILILFFEKNKNFENKKAADRLLMGSVAGYCVKHCQLPVTSMKY